MNTKKNILFWPRAAGLGDLFKALAGGMKVFNKEPFDFVCGMYPVDRLSKIKHYVSLYHEIPKMFSLCQKTLFAELPNKDKVKEFKEELLRSGHNVFALPDSEDTDEMHARKICMDNSDFILNNYADYICCVDVRDEVKACLDKTKINICLHLRLSKELKEWSKSITYRNVDLNKWLSFSEWLALDGRYNLLLIGDSNSSSPFFIDEDKLQCLKKYKNVSLMAWQYNTSLKEDIYCVKESDIFIGGHSGITALAMLLNKPLISYDWGKPLKLWPFHNPLIQKRYFLHQSLSRMKELFISFFNNSYLKYKDMSVRELFAKQEVELQNDLFDILNKKKSIRQFPSIKEWNNFDEAYFSLAFFSVKIKMYDEAEKYLKKTNEAVGTDIYELYFLARQFKDNDYKDMAVDLLDKLIVWAKIIDVQDILQASYFHLGEVYMNKGEAQKAKNNFELCLSINPSHKKARELLEK